MTEPTHQENPTAEKNLNGPESKSDQDFATQKVNPTEPDPSLPRDTLDSTLAPCVDVLKQEASPTIPHYKYQRLKDRYS